jgi:hypothetical protein
VLFDRSLHERPPSCQLAGVAPRPPGAWVWLIYTGMGSSGGGGWGAAGGWLVAGSSQPPPNHAHFDAHGAQRPASQAPSAPQARPVGKSQSQLHFVARYTKFASSPPGICENVQGCTADPRLAAYRLQTHKTTTGGELVGWFVIFLYWQMAYSIKA